ncbi:50S ribosomal protein L14e [Candidatus Woesearchaeota archaeon]|nr:50S ribosomal protein L14e [Candidatus Woesearchaeota archaeon]
MVLEIGRVCIKIAGRDAGRHCAVVDILDSNYVLIDGATRRRKCSILHLEPTAQKVELKKGASHEEVKAAFAGIQLEVLATKPKHAAPMPKKIRKSEAKSAQAAPEKKGAEELIKKKDSVKKEAAKKNEIDAEIVSEEKSESSREAVQGSQKEKPAAKKKSAGKE